MLVALCPLKPTNPKPRGPPRRAALWLRKNPQLRSSFIADDNEQYRPKIAGGDFLPGVHIRVGGFADVSQSNGKRKITIYPVFRVLYPNQGDSGRYAQVLKIVAKFLDGTPHVRTFDVVSSTFQMVAARFAA
jgi:hypothetical protein